MSHLTAPVCGSGRHFFPESSYLFEDTIPTTLAARDILGAICCEPSRKCAAVDPLPSDLGALAGIGAKAFAQGLRVSRPPAGCTTQLQVPLRMIYLADVTPPFANELNRFRALSRAGAWEIPAVVPTVIWEAAYLSPASSRATLTEADDRSRQ